MASYFELKDRLATAMRTYDAAKATAFRLNRDGQYDLADTHEADAAKALEWAGQIRAELATTPKPALLVDCEADSKRLADLG